MYYKNLRDEESIEMLDIIRKSVVIDYGDVIWLNIVEAVRSSMISSGSGKISSTLAKTEKMVNKYIKDASEKAAELS